MRVVLKAMKKEYSEVKNSVNGEMVREKVIHVSYNVTNESRIQGDYLFSNWNSRFSPLAATMEIDKKLFRERARAHTENTQQFKWLKKRRTEYH